MSNQRTELAGFAMRLRAARQRAGLNRKQLCAAARVNAGSVRKWELGEMAPRADSLKRLCRALDVSADWLLGLDKET